MKKICEFCKHSSSITEISPYQWICGNKNVKEQHGIMLVVNLYNPKVYCIDERTEGTVCGRKGNQFKKRKLVKNESN
jgi:hypothetical protein